MARAARTGGAALAGLARAAGGLAPADGGVDVRTFAGLPIEAAIDRIVDAFCPPGIIDEDLARMAMGEALARALDGVDRFDPAAVDANAIRLATLTYAAELAFLQIASEAGKSFQASGSPAEAVKFEADVRSLVHVVSDVVGGPIFDAAGAVLTPAGMERLISQIVGAAVAEMETWE